MDFTSRERERASSFTSTNEKMKADLAAIIAQCRRFKIAQLIWLRNLSLFGRFVRTTTTWRWQIMTGAHTHTKHSQVTAAVFCVLSKLHTHTHLQLTCALICCVKIRRENFCEFALRAKQLRGFSLARSLAFDWLAAAPTRWISRQTH